MPKVQTQAIRFVPDAEGGCEARVRGGTRERVHQSGVCEAEENRRVQKLKQGEAVWMSRLENSCGNKGIVRGPFQPLRSQTRTDPNSIRETHHQGRPSLASTDKGASVLPVT